MANLVKLLKYAKAGSNERKKILDHEPDKRLKTLLLSEDIESTTLIQEEVFKTVLEGAEPVKCMRDALNTVKIGTNSLRYVYGEAGTYADEIAEGAEIPIDTQDYDNVTFLMKKIGVRPLITKELIEDGLFDVIDLEIRKAGARLENKLNRDCLDALVDGCTTNNVDVASGNLDIDDLVLAVSKVKGQQYKPDTLVLHPVAEGELLGSTNLIHVSLAGTDEALRRGTLLTPIVGLKPFVCGVTTATDTNWEKADGSKYALVYDRDNAGAIAMRRDLTIERYDDPIRDLVGMSLTMRYDIEVLAEKAICEIISA
jgi:hypothetical protein